MRNLSSRILAHFAKIDILFRRLIFWNSSAIKASGAARVSAMTTSQTNESVFIGIDLGGITLKGSLVAATGEIINETRIETEQRNANALFGQLTEAALALRDDKRAEGRVVAGIGVGIPGLVNRKTNRIEVMPNLPGFSEIDIKTELTKATALPVILDNDANAAAYGELQVGAARGKREVFFVSLGTGIGA